MSAELEKISNVDLRKGIFRLIEHQIEIVMFANVREEYAFKVLDSATAADADDFESPKRALMVIAAILFGGAFGIFIALVRYRISLGLTSSQSAS